MDIETLVTKGLGNATHLVANDAGEAVVVDPPRDAWRVEAAAAERGWRITHVLETHVHNDYLSGALELRASVGAEILAPARGRYAFAHRPLDDGDAVDVGGLRFVARATPGHTPEHLAWDIVPLAAVAAGPVAVANGGSLLVGSAGRTDLLGPAATDELTAAQYRTLRSLAALPPSVHLLPTHGSGSFCAAGPVARGRTTSVGEELAHNPLLVPMDSDSFRMTVLAGFGPYPTYYREMAPLNRAGPALLGSAPVPPMLDPAGVRQAVAAGAVIVDARSREAFAAGHIDGSLGIELGDSFASYVGWLVPFGAPLVLILPEPVAEARADAVAGLLRVGYDRVVGVLDGGVDVWAADGGPMSSYPVVAARTVAEEVAAGTAGRLLDVRDPNELRDDGRLDGALAIPLGELQGRLDEVRGPGPLTVLCKSGQRASMAAGLLEAAGIDVRLVARRGASEILAAVPAVRASA